MSVEVEQVCHYFYPFHFCIIQFKFAIIISMFHSLHLNILFIWCRSRRSRMTLSITSKRLTRTLILKRTLTSMMKSILKISQKWLLGQLRVRDYWNLTVTRLTFAFVFQVKPAIATKQRVAHLHLAVPPLQSHRRPWIINRERDLPQRRRAMPRLPRQTIRMNGEREPTDPLPMNPTLKHPPLPRSSRLLSKRKSFKLLPANHRQVCALYASSRTWRLNFSSPSKYLIRRRTTVHQVQDLQRRTTLIHRRLRHSRSTAWVRR